MTWTVNVTSLNIPRDKAEYKSHGPYDSSPMCYRMPFYIQFLVEKKKLKAAQAESKSAKFRM